MNEVSVRKSINLPALEVWKALSSFRGIENYSPIERSETVGSGPGAQRTCYLPDGAAIYEELNFTRDEAMEMQYQINQGPFPVEGYVSDIKINATGESSCEITWACEFNSTDEVKAEMEKLFGGFYHTIINQLEGYLKN